MDALMRQNLSCVPGVKVKLYEVLRDQKVRNKVQKFTNQVFLFIKRFIEMWLDMNLK